MVEKREVTNANLPLISAALSDPEVVRFTIDVYKESYEHNFPDNETNRLVEKAFEKLLEIPSCGDDQEQIGKIILEIYNGIYEKNDPGTWFNRGYSDYKANRRPIMEFMEVRPYLEPQDKILDFGSGSGELAAKLHAEGYTETSTTDVLDYRSRKAKQLEQAGLYFKYMEEPDKIPYGDDLFDVSLVRMVLHHIDIDSLPIILNELRRVSQRLIIEESVYGFSPKDEIIHDLVHKQIAMRKYVELNEAQQRMFLTITDFIANALAYGHPEMNMPFNYRKLDEWDSLLLQYGFRVTDKIVKGFEEDRVTPDCRALILCEKV